MIPVLAVMAIGAAVGATVGGISKAGERRRQRTDLQRQKELAAKSYAYKQQYADASFNLQRGAALENLGIARNRLASAFGADIEGFNLGLEGQALQTQSAHVSLAEGIGAALAAQGANGTRGSDSLSRQIGFHETQFARQEDLQERKNSLMYANMSRQYTNQFDNIGREVDSWNPGGYRYEAKGLSDTYASQVYGLQQQGFQYQEDDLNNPTYAAYDYLSAILGGIGQGSQIGSGFYNYWQQR